MPYRMPPEGSTTALVLKCVYGYFAEMGIPPTIRDIKERAHLSSTSIVAYHLRALAKRGIIQLQPRMSRGIRIVQSPQDKKMPAAERILYLENSLRRVRELAVRGLEANTSSHRDYLEKVLKATDEALIRKLEKVTRKF